MRVALIGATGNAGSRILKEAVDRGHEVTAIVRRPERVPALPGVTAARGDVHDGNRIADLVKGHDAVLSSVRFIEFDPDILLAAITRSDVRRYLVVGGAGSLEVQPGQLESDRSDYSAPALENSKRGGAYLDKLRAQANLDWTFLSPSRKFLAGERTGTYRLGTDRMLFDSEGVSSISFEDFAKAMVDELDKPQHVRRRFTVGY